MENIYVRLINCRLHIFRSSASSFSSQYLLLFLKSSRSCVLLLFTPFTSVICPSMTSWRRQFLLRVWAILLDFLRMILFRSVLFFPIRSRTCSLVTFICWYLSVKIVPCSTFVLLRHHQQSCSVRKIWPQYLLEAHILLLATIPDVQFSPELEICDEGKAVKSPFTLNIWL